MHRTLGSAAAAALLLVPHAVRGQGAPGPTAAPAPSATAEVAALGGSPVKGLVRFTQVEGGVEIDVEITGLAPGRHGFHIHEFGDCSAPDGSSAGPTFNPAGTPHGVPGAATPHADDFATIEADASGRALVKLVFHAISLDEGTNGVVGRSVIVNDRPDDHRTAPTGSPGRRVGCGVILLDGGNTILVRKQ